MTPAFETLVGSIYDCAADPGHWPQALDQVRDAFDAAYVGIGVAVHVQSTSLKMAHYSSWDGDVPQHFSSMMAAGSDGDAMLELPEDVSWSHLSRMQESEFKKTSLYQDCLRPQKLRDVLGVNSIKRRDMRGILTMPTAENREPVTLANRHLAEQLSPHIRRAMTINDLTNNSVLALSLYRQVLDSLAVAVFIVGPGQRLLFTNASGDAMLSEGQVVSTVSGALKAQRGLNNRSTDLDDAISQATANDMSLEFARQGIPLISNTGELAAAYVIPFAREFGRGHCAVFVTRRSDHSGMALDVLRGLFNLTAAEARIALLVAGGEGPQRVAASQGIAINTVRTHLKHIYSKMDVNDQTALAGLVIGLLPPVA